MVKWWSLFIKYDVYHGDIAPEINEGELKGANPFFCILLLDLSFCNIWGALTGKVFIYYLPNVRYYMVQGILDAGREKDHQ